MPFWAVIRAVPHHERLAHEGVALAGYETFIPRIRERVGARWRTTPLFGVYFFARVIDQWRKIERTMGVAAVVKVGAVPSRCPDTEIAALIERSDADDVIRLTARPLHPPRRIIAPGSTVSIVDGPLNGFAGLYVGQTAQEREMILINILGSTRPVEIAAGLLAPQ